MFEDELLDDGFEDENGSKLGTIKIFFALSNAISLLVIICYIIEAYINQGLGSYSENITLYYIEVILTPILPLVNAIFSICLSIYHLYKEWENKMYINLFLVCIPWVYWLIFVFGLIMPWAE